MQRYQEPNPVPRSDFLWQHGLLTGWQRTRSHAMLETLQQLIRQCRTQRTSSFKVLRVNKLASVTAPPMTYPKRAPPRSPAPNRLPATTLGRTAATGPFLIPRKPVPRPSPAHRAQPALPPRSHGRMPLTPCPHNVPRQQSAAVVTPQEGVIGNEYRSIHRPPHSACCPRRLQSPRQASLARAGPRDQQVGVNSRAATKRYIPFRPGNNTDRPRDHAWDTPGTNSHVPSGMKTAPRVSEQALAGPELVTVPKPPSRARPSSIPVPIRRRQGQGTPVAAPPVRATPPQVTKAPPTPPRVSRSGPAAARDDDRLTLPTQQRRWERRGAVVGMAAALTTTQPKIAPGTQREVVTRRAAAVPRQQASPRRPPLRDATAGRGYTTGGPPLRRQA